MNDLIFDIDNISFSYLIGNSIIYALRKMSFQIPAKKLTTLLGPSGSGKSTLLHLLGLIEPLQEGNIYYFGKNLKNLRESEKNSLRKYEMGFIFQQFHLIPVLTAEENVAYFLKRQGLSKNEVSLRCEEVLNRVGLWEHRFKKPNQMSGGQQQRLSIARALVKSPKVIIGDEPTANLDQRTGHEIMQIFTGLVEEKGISVILTTHDPMVQSYANQQIYIQDGLLLSEELL